MIKLTCYTKEYLSNGIHFAKQYSSFYRFVLALNVFNAFNVVCASEIKMLCFVHFGRGRTVATEKIFKRSHIINSFCCKRLKQPPAIVFYFALP